jgi:hypothetical protein
MMYVCRMGQQASLSVPWIFYQVLRLIGAFVSARDPANTEQFSCHDLL